MPRSKEIYCCQCDTRVKARLTTGKEIYPPLVRLWSKAFWICDTCRNYVGTHENNPDPKKRTDPLGCIATPEMRSGRIMIHEILDPMWRGGIIKRGQLYKRMTEKLGMNRSFHTSKTRSMEEVNAALQAADEIRREVESEAKAR